jgi:hypothetical protein
MRIALSDLVRKPCDIKDCSITFYPKTTTSYAEMDDWLEMNYGIKDNEEYYWMWRGFGKEFEENFSIVLIKKTHW